MITVLDWTCGPFKELEKHLAPNLPLIEFLGHTQSFRFRNFDGHVPFRVLVILKGLQDEGCKDPIAIPSSVVIEPPPMYGDKTLDQWRSYLQVPSMTNPRDWSKERLLELVEAVETQTLKDSKGPLLNVIGWTEEKARLSKAIEALKIPANPEVIDTRTIHWNSAVDAALREIGARSEPTHCNICNNPECDTPNGKH